MFPQISMSRLSYWHLINVEHQFSPLSQRGWIECDYLLMNLCSKAVTAVSRLFSMHKIHNKSKLTHENELSLFHVRQMARYRAGLGEKCGVWATPGNREQRQNCIKFNQNNSDNSFRCSTWALWIFNIYSHQQQSQLIKTKFDTKSRVRKIWDPCCGLVWFACHYAILCLCGFTSCTNNETSKINGEIFYGNFNERKVHCIRFYDHMEFKTTNPMMS